MLRIGSRRVFVDALLTGVVDAHNDQRLDRAPRDQLFGGVVESPLIDIVDIAVPPDLHAEIAIAAAKNGKHILCEKVFALNVKQAEQMLAAATKAKVVHMVCHNYRRIPAIVLAKKMIAEGALGRIYHFRARYAQDRLADPEFPLDWRLQKVGRA